MEDCSVWVIEGFALGSCLAVGKGLGFIVVLNVLLALESFFAFSDVCQLSISSFGFGVRSGTR